MIRWALYIILAYLLVVSSVIAFYGNKLWILAFLAMACVALAVATSRKLRPYREAFLCVLVIVFWGVYLGPGQHTEYFVHSATWEVVDEAPDSEHVGLQLICSDRPNVAFTVLWTSDAARELRTRGEAIDIVLMMTYELGKRSGWRLASAGGLSLIDADFSAGFISEEDWDFLLNSAKSVSEQELEAAGD